MENRPGENNPQYGKYGKNHPSCKKITLLFNNERISSFNGNKECKEYFEHVQKHLNYNTLRQYSAKKINYHGYSFECIKT